MIKKSTTITFEDTGETIEDQGGIPLSIGERVYLDHAGKNKEYIVSRKTVTCRKEGDDWIADVRYWLGKA